MPLGVLALKVSERRGDHASQILSHEEHDIVDFSLLVLGASWSNIYVFANMPYTLLALYWLVHGTMNFPTYGAFHASRIACYSLSFYLDMQFCSALTRHFFNWPSVSCLRCWGLQCQSTPHLLPSHTCTSLHHALCPHFSRPLLSYHIFHREYLDKIMAIPYKNKQK